MAKRTKKDEEEKPTADLRLDEQYWPDLPLEARGREVIFQHLHAGDEEMLRGRGYDPIVLRRLPMKTAEDAFLYNRYVLRGLIEGTVWMTEQQQDALALDMKHRKMLDPRQAHNETGRKKTETVDDMLDWDKSRHTMDNTTVVGVDKVREFVEWRAAQAKKEGDGDEQVREGQAFGGTRQVLELPEPKLPRDERGPDAGRRVRRKKSGSRGKRGGRKPGHQ